MEKVKKTLVAGLIGVGGLLLTLAGLSLIELSQTLILYTGILYLIISVLTYFLL